MNPVAEAGNSTTLSFPLGGRTFTVQRELWSVADLKLDPNNQRLGYLLRTHKKGVPATDAELHAMLWDIDQVKDLNQSIFQNGGLIEDPIIYDNGVVVEGNCRTVCLRELRKKYPTDSRFEAHLCPSAACRRNRRAAHAASWGASCRREDRMASIRSSRIRLENEQALRKELRLFGEPPAMVAKQAGSKNCRVRRVEELHRTHGRSAGHQPLFALRGVHEKERVCAIAEKRTRASLFSLATGYETGNSPTPRTFAFYPRFLRMTTRQRNSPNPASGKPRRSCTARTRHSCRICTALSTRQHRS